MPIEQNKPRIRSTTVLCVRKDNKVVLASDGQVTMGEGVIKHNAKKTRRLYNDKILAGFAGSTSPTRFPLFGRFEKQTPGISRVICPARPLSSPRSGAPTVPFATSKPC